MNNIPIIRLEIEGMKHTVHQCLSEYAARMDSDVQAAIDEALTPENIRAIIRAAASREIKDAIESEIHRFFTYDPTGAKFIRDAVDVELKERVASIARFSA